MGFNSGFKGLISYKGPSAVKTVIVLIQITQFVNECF